MTAEAMTAAPTFAPNPPAPDAWHAPGTPADHLCAARLLEDCACGRRVVFCSTPDEVIEAICDTSWRCSSCQEAVLCRT
jgi:hypothetical protein